MHQTIELENIKLTLKEIQYTKLIKLKLISEITN